MFQADELLALIRADVRFVVIGGLGHLIAMKRAAGRPQDLRDLEELEPPVH